MCERKKARMQERWQGRKEGRKMTEKGARQRMEGNGKKEKRKK